MTELDNKTQEALFEYLLRLGDDLLVLGHRLSEWCGHGPILEEDLALANISLDLIGQAEAILSLAGKVEGKGRSEDDLAYFRDEYEFRNLQLVEQPRGDFAQTIARQFLFDAMAWHFYDLLKSSSYEPLAAIASKVHKETTYHLRHSRAWIHRLGDGTTESHDRLQRAIDEYWTYTGELFFTNEVDELLLEKGMIPDLKQILPKWRELVSAELQKGTLTMPEDGFMASGSRLGRHSEHLGHMLAEMQILARSHPGATW